MKNAIAISTLLLFGCALTTHGAERPNVVLIVCDDLNDYLGCMGGHPQAITPNMDKLAASGVLFSRAYSNNPICGPSRSSFMSGIYPHTSKNLWFDPPSENPVLSNSRMLMEHFRANGYYTVGSGKLMHHYKPDRWDEFAHRVDYGPHAYDGEKRVAHPSVPEPFRANGQTDGSFASLDDVPFADDGNPESGWIYGQGRITPLRYSSPQDRDPTPDERNAAWAANRIRKFAEEDDGKPFFLGVGFIRPHTPLHVPQKYFDMYPLDALKVPVIQPDDADDTHYREFYFKETNGPQLFRDLSNSYPDQETALKTFTQAYLACVTAVDDCVGQVINALDHSRFRDNTIVVLVSDHGWQMGQKDYLFKNSPWEESCRIPFIVRAPGVASPGGVADHPIALIDLYPTLVDLCNLKGDTRKNGKGAPLAGHSIRPFLQNPIAKTWEGPQGALSMVYAGGYSGMDPDGQHWSLRTSRWRYIVYRNGAEELYDHQDDPREWTNLANSPEYAAIKANLVKQMLDMRGLENMPPFPAHGKERAWFAALDDNSDEVVTEQEWLDWARRNARENGGEFNEVQQRRAFFQHGGKEDGGITRQELKANMKRTFAPEKATKAAGEYAPLRKRAKASLDNLRALVEKAQASGVETSRENVTVVTAEQFMTFADWDHSHPNELQALCAEWWKLKDRAEPYARELPFREMREIQNICDAASVELQAVIDDPKSRRAVPVIDHSNAHIKVGYFHDGDTPLFPSGFSWMPREPDLVAAYGNIRTAVIATRSKKTPDTVARVQSEDRGDDIDSIGYIHFIHNEVPDWYASKNEGIGFPQQCFTKYDIDHPGTRVFWRQLLEDTIPQVAGTNRSRAGYMLANEPHWYTATKQWDTQPVSEFTKDKFRHWLASRYGNKITTLNDLWGTEFGSFQDVTIEIPIDRELRGKPIWFDWCRFNMDRVTGYFGFLDREVKKHDPDAKVHIKIMPEHWANDDRSSGIDMEQLVRLQDIVGCDAKVGNRSSAADWEQWPERYALKWEELVLSYEFFKSIAPDKLIFDSEFHGLTTVHWRDENLSPEYTNCLLWLAHLHGMGMNQTWYWGRESDGAPKAKAARDFYGSNLTQPRVMNQFGRTMKDLNAFAPEVITFAREPKHIRLFYSETDAINNRHPLAAIKHTYQELYHLGHPIGFATGQMLADSEGTLPDGTTIKSTLVVVHNATRVTKRELEGLQKYLDLGGQLLLIGEGNLSQDEYGRPHIESLKSGKGSVSIVADHDTQKLLSVVDLFLTDAGLQKSVIVKEQNSNGQPGCLWRTVSTDDGHLLLLINIGNGTAKLEIAGQQLVCRDLFTGAPHPSIFDLEALGLKLLHIAPKQSNRIEN